MKRLFLVVLSAGMMAGGFFLQTGTASERPRVPRCEEDEILHGVGDFERGRWTRYVCIHPDVVTAETIENDFRNPTVYATVRGSVCEHRRFWKREGIIPAVEETCH